MKNPKSILFVFGLLGVSVFPGSAFSDGGIAAAPPKMVSCRWVGSMSQNVQPDFVACGDYQGWTSVSAIQGVVVKTRSPDGHPVEFDLPAITPLYLNGPSPSVQGQMLPRCYYDSGPHTDNDMSMGEWSNLTSYHTKQTELASLYSVNRTAPECSKAGIIAENGKPQPFCAAYITCMGEKTAFHTCKSSADDACPPADECLNPPFMRSSDDQNARTADTFVDSHHKTNLGIVSLMCTKLTSPGLRTQTIRGINGSGLCFSPTFVQLPYAKGFSTAGSRLDQDGNCLALEDMMDDSCVVGHGPANIQSYGGQLLIKSGNSGAGNPNE